MVVTGILVFMIFGLMGTIFYITNILITPDASKSKIAAKKSKAADITYSKDIDLKGGACPTDVKQCPDGSYVSRVAPNCEFAACPSDGSIKPPASPTPDNVILPVITSNPPPGTNPTEPPKSTIEPPTPTEPQMNPTATAPSPTEKLLADNSEQSEQTSSYSTSSDISPTLTPMSSLPRTGLVTNSIIAFTVSSLLLLLAFLY